MLDLLSTEKGTMQLYKKLPQLLSQWLFTVWMELNFEIMKFQDNANLKLLFNLSMPSHYERGIYSRNRPHCQLSDHMNTTWGQRRVYWPQSLTIRDYYFNYAYHKQIILNIRFLKGAISAFIIISDPKFVEALYFFIVLIWIAIGATSVAWHIVHLSAYCICDLFTYLLYELIASHIVWLVRYSDFTVKVLHTVGNEKRSSYGYLNKNSSWSG